MVLLWSSASGGPISSGLGRKELLVAPSSAEIHAWLLLWPARAMAGAMGWIWRWAGMWEVLPCVLRSKTRVRGWKTSHFMDIFWISLEHSQCGCLIALVPNPGAGLGGITSMSTQPLTWPTVSSSATIPVFSQCLSHQMALSIGFLTTSGGSGPRTEPRSFLPGSLHGVSGAGANVEWFCSPRRHLKVKARALAWSWPLAPELNQPLHHLSR